MVAKSKEHPNFYENLKEAELRLRNTVVAYDGVPHQILCLADGKDDGIIRAYMEPVRGNDSVHYNYSDIPLDASADARMVLMDKWMAANPNSGVVRKFMSSAKFNKFRPFPLGMCNFGGKTYYIERHPQRHTQQGLIQSMTFQTLIRLEDMNKVSSNYVNILSYEFVDCVLGNYPSFDDCCKNLLNPDIANDSAAFHRHFALCRGPAETLFLVYKTDVVACIPNGDNSVVRLSSKFGYLKEVVEELSVFKRVNVN